MTFRESMLAEFRQRQLDEIRAQVGDAHFRALVDKVGEEEVIRAFEHPADEKSSYASRVLGRLKRNRLFAVLPLMFGLVFVVVGLLEVDSAGAPIWTRALVLFFLGAFAGLVANFFALQLHVLMAGYRDQFQIAGAVVAVGSVIASLVFFVVPSLSARNGWIALGVAGLAAVFCLVATFYTIWACAKCGSFDTEKLVEVNKLPGYDAVEHHSRRCNECGYRWASFF